MWEHMFLMKKLDAQRARMKYPICHSKSVAGYTRTEGSYLRTTVGPLCWFLSELSWADAAVLCWRTRHAHKAASLSSPTLAVICRQRAAGSLQTFNKGRGPTLCISLVRETQTHTDIVEYYGSCQYRGRLSLPSCEDLWGFCWKKSVEKLETY